MCKFFKKNVVKAAISAGFLVISVLSFASSSSAAALVGASCENIGESRMDSNSRSIITCLCSSVDNCEQSDPDDLVWKSNTASNSGVVRGTLCGYAATAVFMNMMAPNSPTRYSWTNIAKCEGQDLVNAAWFVNCKDGSCSDPLTPFPIVNYGVVVPNVHTGTLGCPSGYTLNAIAGGTWGPSLTCIAD